MMKFFSRVLVLLVAVAIFAGGSSLATAATPGFGSLYYEGQVVRTVVPPASMPQPGTDDFYAIQDGAEGQLAVIDVAPGDQDYKGGKWAYHSVEWNVAPYLLTSSAAVHAAAEAGDVTITRVESSDFKCPVQP